MGSLRRLQTRKFPIVGEEASGFPHLVIQLTQSIHETGRPQEQDPGRSKRLAPTMLSPVGSAVENASNSLIGRTSASWGFQQSDQCPDLRLQDLVIGLEEETSKAGGRSPETTNYRKDNIVGNIGPTRIWQAEHQVCEC